MFLYNNEGKTNILKVRKANFFALFVVEVTTYLS